MNNISAYNQFADHGRNIQDLTIKIDADNKPFRVLVPAETVTGRDVWVVHEKMCWPHIQFVPIAGHSYVLNYSEIEDTCRMHLEEDSGHGLIQVNSFKELPPCWDDGMDEAKKRFIEKYKADHPSLYSNIQ
jgi:hypothetical protein